jgi:aspartate/methionine/tyrosine aminotransferase
MKDVVSNASQDDKTYAYAPTKGDLSAREFILDHFSNRHLCTVEDIIFFNGLGEAINKIFSNLSTHARVIGPNPTYPSHATAESMHNGSEAITYSLKLYENGAIDLEELENKVKYNESIAGILVINPNNPT